MAMTQRVRRWVALPDDDDGNSLPFHLDEQGNSTLSLAISNRSLFSEQEQVIASLRTQNAQSNDLFKVRFNYTEKLLTL